MHVVLNSQREAVIDNSSNIGYIKPAGCNVRRNQQLRFPGLEILQRSRACGLRKVAMYTADAEPLPLESLLDPRGFLLVKDEDEDARIF